MTAGAIVSLVGQIPGGAIVDAARSQRWAAAAAAATVGISAFALALSPIFVVVFASRILQAGASCVLAPVVAAISLGLVGHKGISTRLGRNAAFASVGSGVAAAAMGASAYYISNRAAFILAASMTLPALLALFQIRTHEIDPARAHGGVAKSGQGNPLAGLLSLFEIRPLLVFAVCMALFQLANAAMLPLAASVMTLRSAKFATILVATSIVAPQLIVAVLSPWFGRKADQWGRRPLLVVCFAALAIRGLLFAFLTNPYLLMAAQLLDGVSGAALAVLVPLIIADVAGASGHFNLAQGAIGSAVGIVCDLPAPGGEPLWNVYVEPTIFVSTRIRPKHVRTSGSRERLSTMQLYGSGVSGSKPRMNTSRGDVSGSRLFSDFLGGTSYEANVTWAAGDVPKRLPSKRWAIARHVNTPTVENGLPRRSLAKARG